ncbi:sce7726 family protein [Acinetobacter baumannii]|uniref:sce7726 family protein n=1 Tax=Acinetobacter baumannii TaxID=470 RepID=UPI000F66A5B8|nr:sce7726 family protein [Acinetobacter baumannii]RSF42605.1 hypothetical protein EGU01_00230 [Acinetobacter baumannii]
MKLDYQTLAKIFNSNTLNDIAEGDLSHVYEIRKNFFNNDNDLTLANIFDKSFEILTKNYPNEYIYKNFIANKILLGKHSLNTATMLTEFRVGKNKADCVILNGKSTCYEIKTDYDSLVRLNEQLYSYCQIFDEVNIVCSYKHINEIKKIPEHIGIILLSNKLTFQEIRKPIARNDNINKLLMMQSLRKDEYIELAQSLWGEKIEAPNTQIFDKCLERIIDFKDDKKINYYFIEILKKYRKNNDILIGNLPRSLANAAISYKFNKKQEMSLIECFKNKDEVNVLSNFKRKIK